MSIFTRILSSRKRMERLADILNAVKANLKDERGVQIIDEIIDIGYNAGYYDWDDWCDYCENDLPEEAAEIASIIDDILKGDN